MNDKNLTKSKPLTYKDENHTEESMRSKGTSLPKTDIYEDKDNIVLCVDLPGVTKEGLNIVLEKNYLLIEGRVDTQAHEHQDMTLAYSEFELQDYRRKFTLSTEIERDKITANLDNGILNLVLPKSQAAKAKKILVQT